MAVKIKRWSKQEIKYLIQHFKSDLQTCKAIADHLQRPVKGIQKKASDLNITQSNKTSFTRAHIAFLKENYKTLTNKQLAAGIGKTLTVTRNKLYEMGLRRYDKKARAWAPAEDNILISNYRVLGDTSLANLLPGRTKRSIRKRRITLNLVRTVDEINNLVEKNLKQLQATQFKPGEKKYTPDHAKIWETRRRRDLLPDQDIIKKIQIRERCNFYRNGKKENRP